MKLNLATIAILDTQLNRYRTPSFHVPNSHIQVERVESLYARLEVVMPASRAAALSFPPVPDLLPFPFSPITEGNAF